MSVSLKQARSVLSATDSRVMLLKDFCDACGVTPTPENLHKVKDAIEAISKTAADMFDLGIPDVPVLVSYRNRKSHGLEKIGGDKDGSKDDPNRVVMPDDPRVKARKSADDRKSAPQVNLMPFVRLVDKAQWEATTNDDILKESLMTGVLKTLADLPDAHRVRFGTVHSVKASPTDGWALATVLVKLS
jgi:hypothetical protein